MDPAPSLTDFAYLVGAFASFSVFTWLLLRALLRWRKWKAKPGPSGTASRDLRDRQP